MTLLFQKYRGCRRSRALNFWSIPLLRRRALRNSGNMHSLCGRLRMRHGTLSVRSLVSSAEKPSCLVEVAWLIRVEGWWLPLNITRRICSLSILIWSSRVTAALNRTLSVIVNRNFICQLYNPLLIHDGGGEQDAGKAAPLCGGVRQARLPDSRSPATSMRRLANGYGEQANMRRL